MFNISIVQIIMYIITILLEINSNLEKQIRSNLGKVRMKVLLDLSKSVRFYHCYSSS